MTRVNGVLQRPSYNFITSKFMVSLKLPQWVIADQMLADRNCDFFYRNRIAIGKRQSMKIVIAKVSYQDRKNFSAIAIAVNFPKLYQFLEDILVFPRLVRPRARTIKLKNFSREY